MISNIRMKKLKFNRKKFYFLPQFPSLPKALTPSFTQSLCVEGFLRNTLCFMEMKCLLLGLLALAIGPYPETE
jgi:hypothetical protein